METIVFEDQQLDKYDNNQLQMIRTIISTMDGLTVKEAEALLYQAARVLRNSVKLNVASK
jgi:hypothetical protein